MSATSCAVHMFTAFSNSRNLHRGHIASLAAAVRAAREGVRKAAGESESFHLESLFFNLSLTGQLNGGADIRICGDDGSGRGGVDSTGGGGGVGVDRVGGGGGIVVLEIM
eukprot:6175992-Pleurochrysis_carterae.AAC.1